MEGLPMRTSDAQTFAAILQHKEYFDQKLIDIVNHLECETLKLNTTVSSLKISSQSYLNQNASLKLKIKDMKAQNYAFKIKHSETKKENDELNNYFRDVQIEIEKLQRELEIQKTEIEKQRKEIEKQEKIINKMKHGNSTNSHFPSSLDILSRTKSKAEANTRVKTDRKRGGQAKHPLHKSKISKDADCIIELTVKKAPNGAAACHDENGNTEYYRTQEIDLIIKSKITETRYYIDPKGQELDAGILQKYAINPVTYTPHFKASVVYLNQKGTIPLKRLSDMMSDISRGNIQLSTGTISKWCEEGHHKSHEMREGIFNDILNGSIVHVDETGAKVSGDSHWIHVLANHMGAGFIMTKGRSDLVNNPASCLDTYTGVMVHDHFSTYQKLLLCQHAECNAHIDRYLKSGMDFDHSERCRELLELLHKMLHRKHELLACHEINMPDEEIMAFENEYVEIIEKGLREYDADHPSIEKKYEADYVKTFRRMLKYKEDHLRFMKNFEVPYSNNFAESQCRAVKAKKNSSKQFVTEKGGEIYASLLTILQTAKIKNENALEYLEKVFQ